MNKQTVDLKVIDKKNHFKYYSPMTSSRIEIQTNTTRLVAHADQDNNERINAETTWRQKIHECHKKECILWIYGIQLHSCKLN